MTKREMALALLEDKKIVNKNLTNGKKCYLEFSEDYSMPFRFICGSSNIAFTDNWGGEDWNIETPLLEVDTKVVVWNACYGKKHRYFSHFDESGRIYCFMEGKTSWSGSINEVACWEHYEVASE